MNQIALKLKIYKGPSIDVPFKAIVLNLNYREFFKEIPKPIETEELAALDGLVNDIVIRQLDSSLPFSNAAELIASLTLALLEASVQFLGPRSEVIFKDDADCLIAIENEFDSATIEALMYAVELVSHVKKLGLSPKEQLARKFGAVMNALKHKQLGNNSTVLIAAAKQLNIPHYQVSPLDKLISYGQGKNSLFFSEVMSELDSHIGVAAQARKHLACRLIALMGYPVPLQAVVYDLMSAQRAAGKIGFPVVVKPAALGKGVGVSCDIRNDRHLKSAFELASLYSGPQVIVERHIPGEDHRITVNGKTVFSVFRRTPPTVIGDGVSSIEQLIEKENQTRQQTAQEGSLVYRIPIDDGIRQNLGVHGLRLTSVLSEGQKVVLRSNANASTGGRLTEVTHLTHPDNIEMAIAVTRGFQLNLCGIDFVTTDISRSWKELGKIIEVNASPGIFRVRPEILADKFNKRNNGRIASTLIVSDAEDFVADFVKKKAKNNPNLGFTSSTRTQFSSTIRSLDGKSLYERCLSLLLDRRCDEIAVSLGTTELIDDGLPLDYFDHCIVQRDSLTTLELSQAFDSEGSCSSFLSKVCGDVVFL